MVGGGGGILGGVSTNTGNAPSIIFGNSQQTRTIDRDFGRFFGDMSGPPPTTGSIFGSSGQGVSTKNIFEGGEQPTGNIFGGVKGNIFGSSNVEQQPSIFNRPLNIYTNINTQNIYLPESSGLFGNSNNYSNNYSNDIMPSGIPYIQPDYSDPHGTKAFMRRQAEKEANEAAYMRSEGLRRDWEEDRRNNLRSPITIHNIPPTLHHGDLRIEIKSNIVYPGEPIQFDHLPSNYNRTTIPRPPNNYYSPDPILRNYENRKALTTLTLLDEKEKEEEFYRGKILYIYIYI